jgi:hypothetical protein
MPTFSRQGVRFPHYLQVGERIIELAHYHCFELFDHHPPSGRQNLEPVHQIGPDGSQYVFERRDRFVDSIEVHRRPDTELMLACEDGRLASLSGANT